MIKRNKTTYQLDTEMFDELAKHTIKCDCGHSVVITSKEKKICSWCGNYVYKTPNIKFRYKLLSYLKKR